MTDSVLHVSGGDLVFRCPGCGFSHFINVTDNTRPKWTWNNNEVAPTFEPNIFVKTVRSGAEINWELYEEAYRQGGSEAVLNDVRFKFWCHSFVRDGMIQFLGDCSHKLANQTVPLPPWRKNEQASQHPSRRLSEGGRVVEAFGTVGAQNSKRDANRTHCGNPYPPRLRFADV